MTLFRFAQAGKKLSKTCGRAEGRIVIDIELLQRGVARICRQKSLMNVGLRELIYFRM